MDASQLQNFYPFLMMALILVVFYFILIRPQKKKEKALKDMISSLKVGDEVASVSYTHLTLPTILRV